MTHAALVYITSLSDEITCNGQKRQDLNTEIAIWVLQKWALYPLVHAGEDAKLAERKIIHFRDRKKVSLQKK